MKRREFCRNVGMLGGIIVVAPLVQACAPSQATPGVPAQSASPAPTAAASPLPTATPASIAPASPAPTASRTPTQTPSPQPTATVHPTEETPMGRIAFVKTTDRAAGVRRALELLGVNPVRANPVLLKPNFNSADEAPGSTHPDVLRALAVWLNEMGARTITIADRSGMGDTRTVMRQKGVFSLAQEMGLDTVVLNELGAKDWAVRQSKDYHWAHGFAVPKILLDAGSVVQTCNLKTHRFGGHFTLSLKNSVGFAAKTVNGSSDYMQELHSSPYQRQMIAEINTAYSPVLIVMDGVEALVDGGPDRGKKVSAQVVLAGTDRVAMDAAGVAILRLFGTTPEVSRGKIFEQEQIARAVELGLGVNSPSQIEFVTGDAESAAYAAQIRQVLLR